MVQSTTIADWTFETSQPATAGPIYPEAGSGTGTAYHSYSATPYSSVTGNGSAQAWSATHWNVGDYWQFSVSTLGYQNIQLSWDQTSSNTGPGIFALEYSINGTEFTQFVSYTVRTNASPAWNSTSSSSLYSFNYDLSLITGLNNEATVYFQLVDTNTTSANGGTVASGGTDRVDNFTVTGTQIPDSMPTLAGLVCGLGLLTVLRQITSGSSPLPRTNG